VDTTLGNVDGVTGTGLYKDKKTADDAITDWHAATDKYNDKAALWVTAATLSIDGMQSKIDAVANSRTTYTTVGSDAN